MIRVTLIRHGQTPGNVRRAYIGCRTDECLTPEGSRILHRAVQEKLYPEADSLYVSPLSRCLLTAAILYPGRDARPVPGLQECDFGEFEGKNYEDLKSCPAYQQWLDSGGTLAFPRGESMSSFQDRCCRAFEAVLLQELGGTPEAVNVGAAEAKIRSGAAEAGNGGGAAEAGIRDGAAEAGNGGGAAEAGIRDGAGRADKELVFVVHGGTIMALMGRYSTDEKPYFDYQAGNGEGYICSLLQPGEEGRSDWGLSLLKEIRL